MRDPQIRSRLGNIKSGTDLAAGLSLLRVLDILVWMSGEADPK